MKRLIILSSLLFLGIWSFAHYNQNDGREAKASVLTQLNDPIRAIEQTDNIGNVPKIQVAILLDVSGSMDGLIEQAKSRLWNIVNTMTSLKYEGREPKVEIALYAYGVWGDIPGKYASEYLYQLTPFTSNLDLISEKLFKLKTSGSDEFCGAVIHHATQDLEWGKNSSDMKLIYIAGNETFEQGPVSFKRSIPDAVKKGIYVHTIHCGNMRTGIADYWREAARLGKGKFFNINSDEKIRYIETPYDDKINHANERLNDTYIYFGTSGMRSKQLQMMQDVNASSISKSNMTERAVSKSKFVYNNSEWDLVDAMDKKAVRLEDVDKKHLPSELQNKTSKEIQQIVDDKKKVREAIQKEINNLSVMRQKYIDEELKKGSTDESDLGKAISESILDLAKNKGYQTF